MTLDVLRQVQYDGAYMFQYSPREGTKAFQMKDDVSEQIKTKRLQEIIELQGKIAFDINQKIVGHEEIVLIEGFSRKSKNFFAGRTDSNKVVIIPANDKIKVGDYVRTVITKATQATLFADFISLENNDIILESISA